MKMFGRPLSILFMLLLIFFIVGAVRTPYLLNAIPGNTDENGGAYSALGNEMKMVIELVKSQGEKIASLEEKLNIREETVERQEEMINDLRKTVEEHSDRIQELSSSVNKQNVRIEILERHVKKLDRKLLLRDLAFKQGLSDDVYSNKQHGELKKIEMNSIKEGIPKMLGKSRMYNREIREASISKRAVDHVSFSVYLSHNTAHLGLNQIIKFDKIITNDGNGYNVHSGMFTVPVTGTYMFIFYLNSSVSNVEFNLMADDVLHASGVSRPANPGQSKDVQGGGAVILKLNQGVSVWIQNTENDVEVFSNANNRWVSFSGVLLY